jgi:hypothetical protein
MNCTIEISTEKFILPKIFWTRIGIKNHVFKLLFFAPNLALIRTNILAILTSRVLTQNVYF